MRPLEVVCAQQKFIRDFSSGKLESLFEEFYPLLSCAWVVFVEPVFERPKTFL